MKKLARYRLITLIITVLTIVILLSACNQNARLPETFTYNPGAAFSTNINNEDPRRVLKCTVVFEVIDDAAATELSNFNFVVRNAVITVLGELTIEELTTNRNIQDISQRLVDRVNEAIPSYVDLIVGAYFTEFLLA